MDNTLVLVIIIYLIFSINYNRIRQLRSTADKRKIKDSPKFAYRLLVATIRHCKNIIMYKDKR